MVDYLNQFLLLYMVPLILSYILVRRKLRDEGGPVGIFDILFVVVPFLNWAVTLYLLFDFLFDLFINIVEAFMHFIGDYRSHTADFAERFFRIKDEE